jgi:hypothetical protein
VITKDLHVAVWASAQSPTRMRYLDLNGSYMVLVEVDWSAPSGIWAYYRTCVASNEL